MKQTREDFFSEFRKAEHFKADVNWGDIKDLAAADFLWEVLEPVSVMIGDEEHEEERAKTLSPPQKALHFFWYLDAQVTNGGFIQFYWNGYDVYLPSLKKGLELVGYRDLLDRVIASEQEYDKHIAKFEEWRKKNDWGWLYKNLKEFEKLDDWYYESEEHHYAIFEQYVRQHIDDFIVNT